MQARFHSLNVPAEILLQACIALVDLFVGVGAPTTATRKPGSEASTAATATIENAFIAGGFDIVLELTHVVYE